MSPPFDDASLPEAGRVVNFNIDRTTKAFRRVAGVPCAMPLKLRRYTLMDRDLYMTALRVLSKFASGEPQDPDQVAALRRAARADEAGEPIDELCCRLINRYLSGQPADRKSA